MQCKKKKMYEYLKVEKTQEFLTEAKRLLPNEFLIINNQDGEYGLYFDPGKHPNTKNIKPGQYLVIHPESRAVSILDEDEFDDQFEVV